LSRRDEFIVRVLAVADDEIVGKEDLLPGELIVNGERIETDWGSGMFVPEAHRGRGIGRKLAEHRMKLHDVSCSCGVSSMLFPIYRKLGWHDLSMRRYILLRKARPLARRTFGQGSIGSLVTAAGNVALLGHRALLGTWTSRKT